MPSAALLVLLAAALLALPAARVAVASDDSDPAVRLAALFAEYQRWSDEEFPESAVRRGDVSRAGRLTDSSPEAIERRDQARREFLARADAIDPDALDDAARLDRALFRRMLEDAIRAHGHRAYLEPTNQRWGTHQRVALLADGLPFRTRADYGRYLERLEAAPRMIEQETALMRRGAEEGVTPPRVTLEGLPGQIDALLAPGGLDALAAPIEGIPDRFSARDRNAIRARFETIAMPALRRAVAAYREFVVTEWLPECRETIAARDAPGGAARYADALRAFTTTELTPEEIHAIGLDEVARIRSEMLLVLRRTDFLERRPDAAALDDDALLSAFIEHLRVDPRFVPESPEAMIEGYRALCKRIDGLLPALFRTLPRQPYGVRAVPDFMAPQQTTAYYQGGSLRGGEPGWFVVNTYALDQRPTWEMVPLALHEAVPGHHLQSALALEMEDVPEFRRGLWFTAYGEGWALYAERLGIEMGLYADPWDDFGRLLFEMWRACRLVVDPGLHALGWSREQAVDYLLENTALSRLNVATEVDRYIVWPGQACAYKIGELRFRALRRRCEERLGAAFDVRAFHDVVLGAGSVPLDVLDERVDAWLRSLPIGAAYD